MKKGKRKKYLEFYNKCMTTGVMPYKENKETCGGLCSIFPRSEELKLMSPDDKRLWYWGHSDEYWNGDGTTFTELRQTIVLFMAAMNNEL